MSSTNTSREQGGTPFESLVIGMGGRPGVGTSTIASAIATTEHSPVQMVEEVKVSPDYDGDPNDLDIVERFRSFIHYSQRQALLIHGAPPQTEDDHDHETLRAYHERMRREGNGAEIIDILGRFTSNIVLFEKVRHPADVAQIQSRGGYFLYADAPENVSDDRFLQATSNGKHLGQPGSQQRRDELARAKQELTAEDNDVHASDVLATRDMADEVVDFSGDMTQTIKRVQLVICRFALDYLAKHPVTEYLAVNPGGTRIIRPASNEL